MATSRESMPETPPQLAVLLAVESAKTVRLLRKQLSGDFAIPVDDDARPAGRFGLEFVDGESNPDLNDPLDRLREGA